MHRATAERLLAELLDRVHEVNDCEWPDNEYLYTVEEVRVFGSYITRARTLGDLDIAVKLKQRKTPEEWPGLDGFIQWLLAYSDEHAPAYVRANYFACLYWPERQTLRFVRGRSGRVSIHQASGMPEGVRGRVIYRRQPTP